MAPERVTMHAAECVNAAQLASWNREQERLASSIVTNDAVGRALKYVGGLDISRGIRIDSDADTPSPEVAVASLVVWELPHLSVVYSDKIQVQLDVPYMATYLGFREVPAFTELIQRAQTRCSVVPDVYLVDGFGTLHPRRCGSASHLGVSCGGVRTIGVAKNLLHVEGLTEAAARGAMKSVREAQTEGPCMVPLCGCRENSKVLGMAVCPPGTSRPIFVSCGHMVGLETAVEVVLASCKHKNPEPLRQADILSRAAAAELVKNAHQLTKPISSSTCRKF